MPVKSDPATWKDPRHRRGVAGEQVARQFLESQGWAVMSHRFRLGRIEVDLIARKGSLVSFIEVKTRRGTAFGSPLEAVTWHKKREIARVAQGWMDRYGRPGDVYRFDVIGVTISGPVTSVQHVTDAFRPGWR
ncbi:MAG: YraN family protein [Gemmatimonadota bacterium]|nr:MAG: YraN family protein [Gemmatimonadota bacterium]